MVTKYNDEKENIPEQDEARNSIKKMRSVDVDAGGE